MTDVTIDPPHSTQPVTLDPTKEAIPTDAPLAQGHDADTAAAVRDADAALREQVKAEEKAAKDASDDAEPKSKSTKKAS